MLFRSKDNITFWGDHSTSEVKELLETMQMKRWWDDDPSTGKSLQIEERGSNLSVGEKQVLAFARALNTGPKIWILDEATSNMDSETEQLLGKSLDRAAANRTMILIAHRLSTVRSADLILVLHKGSLIEKGSHQELVRNNRSEERRVGKECRL